MNVVMGMKEYRKAKFNEKLSKSIQQAKKGKVRTVSSEEINQWEKDLENDNCCHYGSSLDGSLPPSSNPQSP